MCDGCEGPELTLDEILQRARAVIARQRFAVQSVGGSRCSAEFSYTMGLTAHGLPELIVTGLRAEQASRVLCCWADELVWADGAGRWPWEPGHQARRAGQPVLGARAPRFCAEHAPARLDVPPHL